jgi:MoxR-like ATPase
MNATETFRPDVGELLQTMEQVVFGKSQIIQLVIIAMICNDHILLEDVPGTGKTMLITTLAKILDLKFSRIQGTPDLLPGDLTGVNIYNQKENAFTFVSGPIFANILLFDEINRASPKTQAALLEAMAEGQVSIDNTTYKLPQPFFVMATQNPIEHIGTYPLPQAQLDRFLIKTEIGYPTKEEERKIMLQEEVDLTNGDSAKLSAEQVLQWQHEYKSVTLKDDTVDKIQAIIAKTRDNNLFKLGISPRSARKFAKALRASAYIHQRDYVTKDDVFDLFLPVMQHRVFATKAGEEAVLLKELLYSANF